MKTRKVLATVVKYGDMEGDKERWIEVSAPELSGKTMIAKVLVPVGLTEVRPPGFQVEFAYRVTVIVPKE